MVVVLAAAVIAPASADEIVLTTGIPVRGRVLRADETEVVVLTEDGRRARFPRTKVARIRLISPAALRLADDLYTNGHYAAAADAYQRAATALGAGLLRERTRVRLVQCLVASGEDVRAVVAFLDLVRDHPNSSAAVALPLFGMDLNDPAGVIAALEERERDVANDRVLRLLRALKFWAHLSKGEAKEAARLADDLAGDDDPTARSLAVVCRGWQRWRAGQAADAVRQVEAAKPRLTAVARPHADVLLAQCHAALGQHREALLAALHLAFAYDDYPHLAAEGLYRAGLSCLALTQQRRALEMFQRLVTLYPASRRVAGARRRIEELQRPPATMPAGPAPPAPQP